MPLHSDSRMVRTRRLVVRIDEVGLDVAQRVMEVVDQSTHQEALAPLVRSGPATVQTGHGPYLERLASVSLTQLRKLPVDPEGDPHLVSNGTYG